MTEDSVENPKKSIFASRFRGRSRRARFAFLKFVRNRLLTGVIVALPIFVTIWAITAFIQFIDRTVWKFLPASINPKIQFGYDVWGLGLIIAILGLIALGSLASNYFGSALLRQSERLLSRVPVVRSLYSFVKQIVVIVAEQRDKAFREVCLIEYPKAGIWAIGFITTDLQGAAMHSLGPGYVCVFVPTTPNPTSGFLLFSKREDIRVLDMTPEEGAKMIISGGMVTSNDETAEYNTKYVKPKNRPNEDKISDDPA